MDLEQAKRMRVIFQDIDGPLIPLRMYYTGGRLFNQNARSFIYDPIAVGMVNQLASKYDAKIVFNSAHCANGPDIMRHQADFNNLTPMHDDCVTKFAKSIEHRYDAIAEWLGRHPDVTEWIVIDDMAVNTSRQVHVDYNVGMTINNFIEACELFGDKVSPFQFISTVG
jgi:hypothetical protein